jgi:hypothetical protein
MYEIDLDKLDDKPWTKPGADLTDYFNYGAVCCLLSALYFLLSPVICHLSAV